MHHDGWQFGGDGSDGSADHVVDHPPAHVEPPHLGGAPGADGATGPASADGMALPHLPLAGANLADAHSVAAGVQSALRDGVGHSLDAVAAGLHIDNVNVDHGVIEAGADQDHHDPVSLVVESGWLSPTSPLVPILGTALAAALGKVGLKRLTAKRGEQLAEPLARGERVIVVVDADELDRRAGRGSRLERVARIPGQGVQAPMEVLRIEDEHAGPSTVVLDDRDQTGRRTVSLEAFNEIWAMAGRVAWAAAAAPEPPAAPIADGEGPTA